MLWFDAQHILQRHAHQGADARCTWCGQDWPCPPRRLAQRAEIAACHSWRDSWNARDVQTALWAMPNLGADAAVMRSRAARNQSRRAGKVYGYPRST
jgi:hypothetical protein